jgi:hypothetical protein
MDMSGVGLVAVVTPKQVTDQLNASGTEIKQEEAISRLASYVKTRWERARNHKITSG